MGIQIHRDRSAGAGIGDHDHEDAADVDGHREPSYHDLVKMLVDAAMPKLEKAWGKKDANPKKEVQDAMNKISAKLAFRIQFLPREARLTKLWANYGPDSQVGCRGVDNVIPDKAVRIYPTCPAKRNHTKRQGTNKRKEISGTCRWVLTNSFLGNDMTKYNKDYAFLVKNNVVDGYPTLKPDVNTAERRYQYKPLAMGSAPLIFTNGHQEYFVKNKIKEKKANVLFDGATFIVKDDIRMALLALELPTINIHPAVYINGSGHWHEDYWYVAFHEFISCVDREKSRYMPADEDDDDLTMVKYSLDDRVLDAIPLEARLLFRIGGTDTGMVVCHRSLFELFRDDGMQITMIEDY